VSGVDEAVASPAGAWTTARPETVLSVEGLTKRYGSLVAVDAISFQVWRGETFGILGPNGAGKTTTLEMIEGLHGEGFISMRQVRAGLLHFSPDLDIAKGQLAASTVLALGLRPHIIHVVAFCEGDHAATAPDVIESCEIVRGVLRNCLFGMPDLTADTTVQERKERLIAEAGVLIAALQALGVGEKDPLTSPRVIAEAIRLGVLDAPHLKGNPHAAGLLETRAVNGAIHAVDPKTKRVLAEADRLRALPGMPPAALPDVSSDPG